jgi:hypothetical protein
LKTGTGDISSTQKVKFSMCLIKHHAWEAEWVQFEDDLQIQWVLTSQMHGELADWVSSVCDSSVHLVGGVPFCCHSLFSRIEVDLLKIPVHGIQSSSHEDTCWNYSWLRLHICCDMRSERRNRSVRRDGHSQAMAGKRFRCNKYTRNNKKTVGGCFLCGPYRGHLTAGRNITLTLTWLA